MHQGYQSRDARFDGWFILGVTTTGIYCGRLPDPCSAKPVNVRFYASSRSRANAPGFAHANAAGPMHRPDRPSGNTRADIVARAMRLIGDGEVDRSEFRAWRERSRCPNGTQPIARR